MNNANIYIPETMPSFHFPALTGAATRSCYTCHMTCRASLAPPLTENTLRLGREGGREEGSVSGLCSSTYK